MPKPLAFWYVFRPNCCLSWRPSTVRARIVLTNDVFRKITRFRDDNLASDKTVKMAANLELTYQDVAEHNTKKDLYLVIHDQIYDVSKFVDEHP